MEFRKNDLVTLEIEDCGIDGEGIGKADGFTVFVKDAVIGDTVTAKIIKAKKNYGYGRLMEVLKPSPYRVEPKCPVAEHSGSTLTVTVGAVEHPMLDVHHIQWLFVETENGGQLRYLAPGQAPLKMVPLEFMKEYSNKLTHKENCL